MGYRSHVLFAIGLPADVELRITHPEAAALLDEAQVHERSWSDTPEGEVGFRIYEWDQIKWYDTDSQIRSLEDWMEAAENGEDGEDSFSFLRDGEEPNDIEHRGSWNYDLNHGIYIENPPDRLSTENRKALALVLEMVEGEWGEYKEPEFQHAVTTLRRLI